MTEVAAIVVVAVVVVAAVAAAVAVAVMAAVPSGGVITGSGGSVEGEWSVVEEVGLAKSAESAFPGAVPHCAMFSV